MEKDMYSNLTPKMPKAKLLRLIREAKNDGREELDLTQKGIVELPSEIGSLIKLRTLDLKLNYLKVLPPDLGELKNLTSLTLLGNQLETLPPEIGNLTNLERLYLSENKLIALPAHIGHLTKLVMLTLSYNPLRSLPDELWRLDNLEWLEIRTTFLQSISDEIGNLKKLTSLILDDCQLAIIPETMSKLSNLIQLRLSGNFIEQIPPALGRLRELETLDLTGNPLVDPPPEIAQHGAKAVTSYLREITKRSRRQWISKILVVGEGGAGKTCLLDRLRGLPFNAKTTTTHGMNVSPWQLPHPNLGNVMMTLNCWDFGGQVIYHATHQFFLTNQSLFLVVWNARGDFKQGNLYYWLDTIQALAPDSPILIVATHLDERDTDLPKDDLQRTYRRIVGFHSVSNLDGRGILNLKSAVAKVASELRLMGAEWPANWLDAAEVVRGRTEHYISATELKTIFSDHKVIGDSAVVLSQRLHDLGDILFFKHDGELKDTVLLDASWVTETISFVLECTDIVNGVFKREHMEEVWSHIDPTLHNQFLRLMERFDLSYRIPEDPEAKSLVVELLSLNPPDFEESWNAKLQEELCKEVSVKYDLQSTRPAGIPAWFIARSHRFTLDIHWHFGALLADLPDRRHLALVHSPPNERYVSLKVRGPCPHSFLILLMDGLELTLSRFPGLKIKKTINCPGHESGPCEHEFDYTHLCTAIERNPPVLDIQCPVGLENISVVRLLFGIHWLTRESVMDRIKSLESKSAERHRETITELRGLCELIQREFTKLFKREQQYNTSHCPCVLTLRMKNPKGPLVLSEILSKAWELQLYCEAPGCWHPTENGRYIIKEPAKYLRNIAPHVKRLIKVLKIAAPLVHPWIASALPKDRGNIEKDLELMEALVAALPTTDRQQSLLGDRLAQEDFQAHRFEGASLRELRKLLDHVDPSQSWGGLRKLLTPENHYLWLCEKHAIAYG